jgi:large subunit ribosomal protein L10
MAKELKNIIAKQIEKNVGDLDGCVLIDYRGLNAEQTQDLRVSLRKSGVLMNVVPNRLARRVFTEHGAPAEFQSLLSGPTAVLFGNDGALTASKSIMQWRKKNKDLAPIKGGLFQGRALSPAEVERLSALPDASQLRERVLALFLSPLNHLASVTQGLLSHFASACKAHRESLEKEGPGEGGVAATPTPA